MTTTVNPELLELVLIGHVGRSTAEAIIVALDKASAEGAQGSTETAAVSERSAVPGAVGNLSDGDVFSLDQGTTWHTCAAVGFGTVSAYTAAHRDDDPLTIRIPAERD